MRKLLAILWALTLAISMAGAQTSEEWSLLKKDVQLFLANDLGRNGYYEQKPIAELMGVMAETIGPECILAAGDVHHFDGVRSVNDPLWLTNFELIYSHPELQIAWFPILGNHEYRGNTNAVLQYSQVSRRWCMPARYYTRVLNGDSTRVRIVMLDTTPLIGKYRIETEKYPDACLQPIDQQLQWLDSLLTVANEDWVLVVGHHPIEAQTSKDESERQDMQRLVDTILRKHANVAMYLCGHIHNFQHLRLKGSSIDYIVNSSASLSRKVEPIEGTQFCSSEPGFSVISASNKELVLYMIDSSGHVIHTVKRHKQ